MVSQENGYVDIAIYVHSAPLSIASRAFGFQNHTRSHGFTPGAPVSSRTKAGFWYQLVYT